MKNRRTILAVAVLLTGAGLLLSENQPVDTPRYTSDGKLVRPENYREWIWLSSGLGMSYGPLAQNANSEDPPFDNVFVNPAAYRHFLQTGKWPDKTMFVLELRKSLSKASINKRGRFQGEVRAIEVEVKDESRPNKWAFFGFKPTEAAANAIPLTESCYSCHAEHGAVENTFVQFYPTLIEVARSKGTLKPAAMEALGTGENQR
jgi:hypothetical protein